MNLGVVKTCDLCKIATEENEETKLLYGDWMRASNVEVHYFCLLLSTNLPQRGEDFSGICGFLLKDIRREIEAAALRTCCYCFESNASIQCCKCGDYFHIVCGKVQNCLHQFHGLFLSYCADCIPRDEISKVPDSLETGCFICLRQMCSYNPVTWIHARCCGNGYVHRLCMLAFAYNAGYYLKCIWCKNKEFRNLIRMQGIFVPDRDASWEIERHAYRDIHRGHRRCDMDVCICPRGRDFITTKSNGKWPLILCALCGSFGAHNPACIPDHAKSGKAVKTFKCSTCIETEKDTTIQLRANTSHLGHIPHNDSLHVKKLSSMLDGDDILSDLSSPVTVVERRSPQSVTDLCSPVIPDCSNVEQLQQRTIQENNLNTSNGADVHDESSVTVSTREKLNLHSQTTVSMQNLVIADDDYSRYTMQKLLSEVSEPISGGVNESWAIFDAYEFIDMNCIGTCTVRVNMQSPRFAGRTLQDIRANDTFTAEDIVSRNIHRGIMGIIDNILEHGVP